MRTTSAVPGVHRLAARLLSPVSVTIESSTKDATAEDGNNLNNSSRGTWCSAEDGMSVLETETE